MRKLTVIILVAAGLLLLTNGATAQDDLGKQLSKLLGDNAKGYLSPVLQDFGAGLNGGFYHSADLHDILGFDLGLKVGASIVQDADKIFLLTMPADLTVPLQMSGFPTKYVQLKAGRDYAATLSTPTVYGANNGIKVFPTNIPSTTTDGTPIPQTVRDAFLKQQIYETPPGFDVKYMPTLIPQAALGLPLGFEVIGRFIPKTNVSDMGKVSFIGYGIRHDIDRYFPMMPIDIAIHFMTQKFSLYDNADAKVLSGNMTAYGIEVSKSLAILTIYGGYQMEKSKWEIESYNYIETTTNTKVPIPGFSVEGDRTSRFHAGIRLLLLIINVHADYSFGNQPVITAGVGITLR
ncbi:MAG: DUF6588 family protein [bacterium]